MVHAEGPRVTYVPPRALLQRLDHGLLGFGRNFCLEFAPPLSRTQWLPKWEIWDVHHCAYQELRGIVASCHRFLRDKTARWLKEELETVMYAHGKLHARSVAAAVGRRAVTVPSAAEAARVANPATSSELVALTAAARAPPSRWVPVAECNPGVKVELLPQRDVVPEPVLRMVSALVPGLWLAFAPGHLVMLGIFQTPLGSMRGSTSSDVLFALQWLPGLPAYGWFVRARTASHPAWRLDVFAEFLRVPGISPDVLDGRARLAAREALTGFLGYTARLRVGVGSLHGLLIAWRGALFGMLQELLSWRRDEAAIGGMSYVPLPNRGVPIYGNIVAISRRPQGQPPDVREAPHLGLMRVVTVTHPGMWRGRLRLEEVAPPAG